jgi:hypothetical protein
MLVMPAQMQGDSQSRMIRDLPSLTVKFLWCCQFAYLLLTLDGHN